MIQKNTLILQGTTLVRAPTSSTPVGNRFISFINEMYRIQQAAYPGNSPDPRFEYSVTAHLPEVGGFKSGKLNFDGQELVVTGSGATKKFTWPGTTTQSATLNLNQGGGDLEYQRAQGLWATARFFAGYRWQQAGSGYLIQGPLLGPTGQPVKSNNQPVDVRFFSGYGCPKKLAQ